MLHITIFNTVVNKSYLYSVIVLLFQYHTCQLRIAEPNKIMNTEHVEHLPSEYQTFKKFSEHFFPNWKEFLLSPFNILMMNAGAIKLKFCTSNGQFLGMGREL